MDDVSQDEVPHEEESVDLKEIADRLGPFDPPQPFPPEEELQGDAPRPVPRELYQGSYFRSRFSAMTACVGSGAALFVLSFIPFINEMAHYVLALAYLQWIGIGLIAIGACIYAATVLMQGRFAYVRSGVAFPLRVLLEGRYLGGTEQQPQFGFVIAGEFQDPESGEQQFLTLNSEIVSSTSKADRYECTLNEGDYATAVYLPSKGLESARLYGFLGLNPEVDFIRRDGKPVRGGVSMFAVLGGIVAFIAVLLLLVGLLYAMEFRWPMNEDATFIGALAGIGVTAGLVVGILLFVLRNRINLEGGAGSAVILGIGAGIFSALLSGIGLSNLNAMLDDSEPEYREFAVIDYWQTTTTPLFICEYEIEFQYIEDGTDDKMPVWYSRMGEFELCNAGVVEVRDGALNWRYIHDIHPVYVTKLPEELKSDPDYAVFLPTADRDPEWAVENDLALAVFLPDDTRLPISDKLRERIWRYLMEYGFHEALQNQIVEDETLD